MRNGLSRGLLNTISFFLGCYLLVYEVVLRDEPRPELIPVYISLIAGPAIVDTVKDKVGALLGKGEQEPPAEQPKGKHREEGDAGE